MRAGQDGLPALRGSVQFSVVPQQLCYCVSSLLTTPSRGEHLQSHGVQFHARAAPSIKGLVPMVFREGEGRPPFVRHRPDICSVAAPARQTPQAHRTRQYRLQRRTSRRPRPIPPVERACRGRMGGSGKRRPPCGRGRATRRGTLRL